MNVHSQLTSDVVGLTKVAPFSRRGFMTASAAVAAGYTLAAGPVRADVITTSTDGLETGDIKIKVADGEMPNRPQRVGDDRGAESVRQFEPVGLIERAAEHDVVARAQLDRNTSRERFNRRKRKGSRRWKSTRS